jgi:uncharacterized protein YdhG (YjbR/CyaY superfamily)
VDVDSNIASPAREARPHLKELRALTLSAVPQAAEGISYGVPFYKYHGALAGFAAYKAHVSFGLGAGVLETPHAKMLEDKGYKTGKRTVQIRFDQKVPTATIKQILKSQAKLNEAKLAENG